MQPNTEKTAKDYEVGYKKPPKEHQFTKGESGNPRGRPKRSNNYSAPVYAAFRQTITIVQKDGKRKNILKSEAAMTQLMNKAAAGDLKAIRLLFKVMALYDFKPDNKNEGFTLIIEGA